MLTRSHVHTHQLWAPPSIQPLPAPRRRPPSLRLVISVTRKGRRLSGHTHQLSHQVKMRLWFFRGKTSRLMSRAADRPQPCCCPLAGAPASYWPHLPPTPQLCAGNSNATSTVIRSSWRPHFWDSLIPPTVCGSSPDPSSPEVPSVGRSTSTPLHLPIWTTDGE